MKFSTGKVSKMRHATGVDMKKLGELKRKVKALKHSTGEQARLRHATGKEFDYKLTYEELLEEEKKLKQGQKN